jgi:hypothetical protein
MTLWQFYQNTDCGGDVFVSWGFTDELLPPTIVMRAGAWAIKPGTTAMRVVKSYRTVSDSGVSPVCVNQNNNTFTSRFDHYTLEQLNLFAPLSVQ